MKIAANASGINKNFCFVCFFFKSSDMWDFILAHLQLLAVQASSPFAALPSSANFNRHSFLCPRSINRAINFLQRFNFRFEVRDEQHDSTRNRTRYMMIISARRCDSVAEYTPRKNIASDSSCVSNASVLGPGAARRSRVSGPGY